MNQPPTAPTVETHVPITAEMPDESTELAVGRPDLRTPSLWQHSVKVTHKVTGREAVVARVDYGTNMFRAFYPNEGPVIDGKPSGRFAERTEWENCRDWRVDVTFSPRELERQQARVQLEQEIAKLDANSLAAVTVLCDDPDPAKALAKLEALRRMGIIKTSSDVAQAAVAEVKGLKR